MKASRSAAVDVVGHAEEVGHRVDDVAGVGARVVELDELLELDVAAAGARRGEIAREA